jgi:CheY-like chemotaxis protein
MAQEPSDRPARLLVVDDDPRVRGVIGAVLRDEGYVVEEAANGAIALERLTRTPLPDLVLLDLMMPGLGGHALRARQLADERIADIPVVVVTGSAASADAMTRLRAAAVLEKPFELDALVRVVAGALRGR